MGVRLVGDSRRLVTKLKRLAKPRLERAGREIGEALVSSTIQRFSQQRAPDGTPWKPLARSTAFAALKFTKKGQVTKASERQAQGRKILVQRGRLKNSISSSASGTKVFVGTNIVYAPTHQFGHTLEARVIRPKNGKALAFGGGFARSVNHPGAVIPARPFIGISEADKLEITRIVKRLLEA